MGLCGAQDIGFTGTGVAVFPDVGIELEEPEIAVRDEPCLVQKVTRQDAAWPLS